VPDLIPEWSAETKQTNLRMFAVAASLVGSLALLLFLIVVAASRDGKDKSKEKAEARTRPHRVEPPATAPRPPIEEREEEPRFPERRQGAPQPPPAAKPEIPEREPMPERRLTDPKPEPAPEPLTPRERKLLIARLGFTWPDLRPKKTATEERLRAMEDVKRLRKDEAKSFRRVLVLCLLDPSAEVKRASTNALHEIDPDCTERALRVLHNFSAKVIEEVRQLEREAEPLLPLLIYHYSSRASSKKMKKDVAFRDEARELLVALAHAGPDDPVVNELVLEALRPHNQWPLCYTAAVLCTVIKDGSKGVPDIVHFIKSSAPKERRVGAMACLVRLAAVSGDKRAADAVEDFRGNTDEEIRQPALAYPKLLPSEVPDPVPNASSLIDANDESPETTVTPRNRTVPRRGGKGRANPAGFDRPDRTSGDSLRSIPLNPTRAADYYARGNAQLSKGNYDQAIRDYNQAIQLDPQLSDAYEQRKLAYKKRLTAGPIPGYQDRVIEGFHALVANDVLAHNDDPAYQRKPLDVLKAELATVATVLPPRAVRALRTILIWVEWDQANC
jgi:tetratricopeptide (TPR) repeat protein